MTYKYRTLHLRGTLTEWELVNETIIPQAGEIVIEVDQENSLHKMKIGDGTTRYLDLEYVMAGKEIASQVLPRVVTIELEADSWNEYKEGEGVGCYLDITLPGVNVTPKSRLDLQPTLLQVQEFKELHLTFSTENHVTPTTQPEDVNKIRICSTGNTPTCSITMLATLVETLIEDEYSVVVGTPIRVSAPVDQDFDAESVNAQSGLAVAQAISEAVFEAFDFIVDADYNENSNNAQSGKAVAQAIKAAEENTEAIQTALDAIVYTGGDDDVPEGCIIQIDPNGDMIDISGKMDKPKFINDLYYHIEDNAAIITGFNPNAMLPSTIVIPHTIDGYIVQYIDEYAFAGNADIQHVIIPNGVISIGQSAFNSCTYLRSVDIPDSVTSIGNSAFALCNSLISITIPNSVTSIGYDAFYNCTDLTNIIIPNSVTSIDVWAFYNCTSLTSITIPDSVTSIGDYAFYNCIALRSIVISNNIKTIGQYAFSNCKQLVDIILPESLIILSECVFKECEQLECVTISNGLQIIKTEAFCGCVNLKHIVIPYSIMLIEKSAFDNCTNLQYIYFNGDQNDWNNINKTNNDILTAVYSDASHKTEDLTVRIWYNNNKVIYSNADYIVEEGIITTKHSLEYLASALEDFTVNQIIEIEIPWTYRKWKSGIVECWTSFDVEHPKLKTTIWNGSGLYWVDILTYIMFPFAFQETPTVTSNVFQSNFPGFLSPVVVTNYNIDRFRLFTPTARVLNGAADEYCHVSISLKGTWKDMEV